MARPSSIEAILERQGRLSEVRRRLADEGGPAREQLPEGPWISVSRQLGTGGLETARRVAERLGWHVYDREIVLGIARHARSREAVLSHHDEHAIGKFDEYVRQLLVPGDLARNTFLRELVHVAWGLARNGNAVLVGRGVNWFLDARFGLRVRLVAPVDARVARCAAARPGVDPAAVRADVLRHDAEQTAFIRQSFARDIDDPLGYDLVINVAALGESAIVDLVLDAARRKLGAAVP